MRKFALLGACALLASASALIAARPTAPSGPVDAQVAFTKTVQNGYQLVVAREDGSGATTIRSSPRMLRAELGNDGNIYFWEGGRFNRMPAAGGSATALFDSLGTVARHSDLSPDGSSMVWVNQSTGEMYRYDFVTNQQTLLTQGSGIIDVSFDYTGQSIIFALAVSATDYALNVIPAQGGTPGSLGLVAPISAVESARSDTTLALTMSPPGGVPYIALWKPGMSSPVRIVDGYNAAYRCNDSAILFTKVGGPGPATYRRQSSGSIALVAKPSTIFPSYRPVC